MVAKGIISSDSPVRRKLPSRKAKTDAQIRASQESSQESIATTPKARQKVNRKPLNEKHLENASPSTSNDEGSLDLDTDFGSPPVKINKKQTRRPRGKKRMKPLPGLDASDEEEEEGGGWGEDDPGADAAAAGGAGAGASGAALWAMVRRGGAALAAGAEDWRALADREPRQAYADLLNFVLWAAGGRRDYLDRAAGDVDVVAMGAADWGAAVGALVADLRDAPRVEEPLKARGGGGGGGRGGGGGGGGGARGAYAEWWARLAAACRRGADLRQDVLAAATHLLVTASSAPFPPLRAAAALGAAALGRACLASAAALGARLAVARRQAKAQARRGGEKDGPKAQGLRRQVSRLETGVAQLEEVARAAARGVFPHRYRDAAPHIRAQTLADLGAWMVAYPQGYLEDGHLKYLGWSLSDPRPEVRRAALGALRPLYEDPELVGHLEAFTARFGPRLRDMTRDVDAQTALQALALCRVLLSRGLLDSCDDEELDAVDALAFDPALGAEARAEALAFVLEHLAAFDPEHRGRDRPLRLAAQLEAVVELCDYHLGPEGDPALCDLLVEAARRLPQKEVLEHWKSYFTLLLDQKKPIGDRKASLLLRIMQCAIQSTAKEGNLSEPAAKKPKKSKKQSAEDADSIESLTVELLKHLPSLLVRFSADTDKIEQLVKLAAYLDPQIISVDRYAASFSNLLTQLKKIFLASSEDEILGPCVATLSRLAGAAGGGGGGGGAAGAAGAAAAGVAGHGRLHELEVAARELFEAAAAAVVAAAGALGEGEEGGAARPAGRRASPRAGGGGGAARAARDQEVRVGRALRQLRHLATARDPAGAGALPAPLLGALPRALAALVAARCQDLEVAQAPPTAAAPATEGLQVLTLLVLWPYRALLDRCRTSAQKKEKQLEENDEVEEDFEEQKEARSIKQLQELLVTCLRKVLAMRKLNDNHVGELSEDQENMILASQRKANEIVGSLRHLFKLGFSQYKVLDTLVWTPDAEFMSLLQHFFEAEEERAEAKALEDNGDDEMVDAEEAFLHSALLPLMKAMLYNHENLNKRQTAAIVTHFVSSGKTVNAAIKDFVSRLKAENPVRYLEVQMATLRLGFERWLLVADPEDQEALRAGRGRFLPLAQRLAASWGVGGLRGAGAAALRASFARFLRMGAQYALDRPPAKLGFLDGLAPFVGKLGAGRDARRELRGLWGEAVAGLPREAMEQLQHYEDVLADGDADDNGDEDLVRWRSFFAFQNVITGGKGAKLPATTRGKAKRAREVQQSDNELEDDIQGSQDAAETSIESLGVSPLGSPAAASEGFGGGGGGEYGGSSSTSSSSARGGGGGGRRRRRPSGAARSSISTLMTIEEDNDEEGAFENEEDNFMASTTKKPRREASIKEVDSEDDEEIFGALKRRTFKTSDSKLNNLGSSIDMKESDTEAGNDDDEFEMTPLPPPQRGTFNSKQGRGSGPSTIPETAMQDVGPSQGSSKLGYRSEGLMTEDEVLSQALDIKRHQGIQDNANDNDDDKEEEEEDGEDLFDDIAVANPFIK